MIFFRTAAGQPTAACLACGLEKTGKDIDMSDCRETLYDKFKNRPN